MADKAPKLNLSNELVVQIFRQVEGSSTQVVGERKTELYVNPTEIKALLEIHDVPRIDWPLMIDRVLFLQNAANDKRPRHKTQPKTGKR